MSIEAPTGLDRRGEVGSRETGSCSTMGASNPVAVTNALETSGKATGLGTTSDTAFSLATTFGEEETFALYISVD